jgi:hypothetical protein
MVISRSRSTNLGRYRIAASARYHEGIEIRVNISAIAAEVPITAV